jgi:diguanylate cyclase (GGDEF)-like protein
MTASAFATIRALPALLALLPGLLALPACASPTATERALAQAVVRADTAELSLTPSVELFVDSSGKLTIDDVSKADFAHRFLPPRGDARNLGRIDAVVWVRFVVHAVPEARGPWVLEHSYLFADRVDVYTPRAGGGFDVAYGGDHSRLSQRALHDRLYLYPLPVRPGAATTVYIRYQNLGLLSLPLTLWRDDALREARTIETLLLGVFYGGLLTLIVYNLAMYAATRAAVYPAYVLYAAAMAAFMFTQNGFAGMYLWPEHPEYADRGNHLSMLLAATTVVFFVRAYLVTAVATPILDRWLLALQRFGIAVLAAVTVLPKLPGFWFTMAFGATAAGVVYTVAVYYWTAQKSRPAGYLTLALTLPVAGAFLLVARNLGLFSVTWLTEHGMQIGTMFELIVLSLGLTEQVAAMRREHEQALRAAAEDGLTGLANRAHLASQLPSTIERAQRNGERVGVLCIDLDHFKPVNDRYGHAAGDAVLKAVAERMRATVRGHDMVARVGGDEFVIVAQTVERDHDVLALAERLNAEIARPIRHGAQQLAVTASIGIALYPQHASDDGELLAHADRAMFAAKDAGRNTFRVAGAAA